MKFIDSIKLETDGEMAEIMVFNLLKTHLKREGVCYHKYPIHSQHTREVDVLFFDKNYLYLMEIKYISLENIEYEGGYNFSVGNYYGRNKIAPLQQVINQADQFNKLITKYNPFVNKLNIKVIVCFPSIKRKDFEEKFKLYDERYIFAEDLRNIENVIDKILPHSRGNATYNDMLEIFDVSGKEPLKGNLDNDKNKIIMKLRQPFLDHSQERLAKSIPDNIVKIRGVAGSGKTSLICQSAAYMLAKNPNWKIAFIFFSRSLYQKNKNLIKRWSEHYGVNYENIKIMHAWGGKRKEGFYTSICDHLNIKPLTLDDLKNVKDSENRNLLALACKKLLEENQGDKDYNLFDAIIVDEGQDLLSCNQDELYRGVQPIYKLLLNSLKTTEENGKRLIIAYDELQSLDNLKIMSWRDLLGENWQNIIGTGNFYKNGIKKSEIMSVGYRMPEQIFSFAIGLCMGLFNDSLFYAPTNKEAWKMLGFHVNGDFRTNEDIEISIIKNRNLSSQYQLIDVQYFDEKIKEIKNVVYSIKEDLINGVNPNQIIIITFDRKWNLLAKILQSEKIKYYCPNDRNGNSDEFQKDGYITITNIWRAKGNEADIVYILGIEDLEDNNKSRNQVYTAITRTRAFLYISGTNVRESLKEEIQQSQQEVFKYKDRKPVAYLDM